MTLALLYAGLLATFPGADPAALPDVKQAYQDAKARTGRSSEDQVRLALWCEAHGLTAERLNHLALAVLSNPANATARGLMGLVSHDGRFQRPEAVAEKAQADPILAEYDTRRSKAPYTADGQWALGVWAEDHGLKEQAKAHFTAVIRLDPTRELAWKRLGHKKREGRWVTDAQLVAEKADVEAQKRADRKWKPLLEKYRAMLEQPSRAGEADERLSEITDPRAVSSIGRVFGHAEAMQPRAARMLGQVDSAAASRGLAFMAIFAKSAEARRVAAETLRSRDAREYADLLIALIRDPIKYEVKPVGGPGSPGVLFVEGKKADLKRIYSPPPAFLPGDTLRIDRSGLPVVDRPVDFFETDRPNVTGHSTYVVSGVGFADRFGSWFASNSGGGIKLAWPIQSSADEYFGISGSSGFGVGQSFASALSRGTTPSDLVGWTQANTLSYSSPSVGSSHSIPGKSSPVGGARHSTPGWVGPSMQNLDLESFFNSPYCQVKNDAEIPLVQVLIESEKVAISAQQQLKTDVTSLERINKLVRDRNDFVVAILNLATGQKLASSRSTWSKWWVDQLGYAFITPDSREKPTIIEEVPLAYQPQLTPIGVTSQVVSFQRLSCFGAGTPVQTIAGPRPIESIQVGDRVLTQDIATGALGYRPILVVHHNPPSPTFRLGLKGDSIISSHFHRFWVAGRGWVMARDLKPGDPVRTLGGVSPVESVQADALQLVYNLDVAEDADFFAGSAAALVHDNTLPDPRLVPFDAAPASLVARRAE